MRSNTFTIPGTPGVPGVIVTVTELGDGSLLFELALTGGVADIRGLFFDVNDAGPFGNLQAVGADVRDRPSEDGAFEGDDDGPHVGFDIGSGQLTPTDDDDGPVQEFDVGVAFGSAAPLRPRRSYSPRSTAPPSP